MVEYLRLISRDSFTSIANNWHRPETLIVVAIVAAVIVIGYFMVRRR
jgi:hypothetical protein